MSGRVLGVTRWAAVAVLGLMGGFGMSRGEVGGWGTSGLAAEEARVTGAGATFPEPLYKKWVVEYGRAHSGVIVDYNGIGSGGGVRALMDKTVGFAGTDAPLSKKEIAALGGEGKLVQVPSCAGGVVPAYNVPGVEKELRFTGEVLAGIFMGKIAKWNDRAIAAINPGVTLPDLAVTPAWRTDGSGTTFVWTKYLGTQSTEFKHTIGAGKQVQWPLGQGGKGNAGVAAVVQQTAGAIGYIESNFAAANKILFGSVMNRAGAYVRASPEAVSAAGAGAIGAFGKGTVLAADVWDSSGQSAYPIASFTYLIVYKDLSSAETIEEAGAVAGFLKWAVSERGGQSFAAEMGYAPLPAAVRERAAAALATITFNGRPLAEPVKP